MATTRPQAEDRPQARDVIRKLARVRNSTITVGVLSAVLAGLVLVGLAWIVLSILDMWLGLGGIALRIVAVLALVLALGALAYNLLSVFRISHSIRSYAARVGRELKDLGLDLVTLLDLAEIDNRKFGYSEILISRAISGIAERVRHLDLQASVRKRALAVYSIPLAGIVVGSLLWWHFDGGSFTYSGARLRYLWGLSRDSGIHIAVEPGDREVLAGSDLEVDAEITAFAKRTPSLHVLTDGEERAYAMEGLDSLGAKERLRIRGHAHYKSTLSKLDRDIAYFVTLGDQATRVFRVSVKEEPRITAGKITLVYPGYTGLGQETLPRGNWDLSAPYGTEALLELTANCAPESAWISVIGEGGKSWDEPLQVMADSMATRMRLAEDFSYTLEFMAVEGPRAKPHGPHTVKVVSDKSPFVRIESPAREIMLEADMLIPLSVMALDDYGISMMKLYYETKGGKGEISLAYHGKTQARCDWTWDISQLDVFPGEALSYYVVVADNDALTGPKYSKTDVYIARVPTVYDLYQEVEKQQDEGVQDLEEVADKTRELKEDLERIAEDMKKDTQKGSELPWEEEQAIKQNLAEQEDVAKRLDEMTSSLDETLDLMSQNNLVNFDVIEKMEEIRQLLNEVATEDMKKALEQMREAMANLTPEEIKAALQNMNLSQEDLLRKLDQAIQILKRLKAEQKMEAVLNLANDIAQGQKEVNDQLRNQADLAGAENKEKRLAEDTSTLKQMMQSLKDLLASQNNPVAGDIEKAGEFLDAAKIEEAMAGMLSQMSSGRRSSALQAGEGLQQNLEQLAGMLSAASESLSNDERQQVMQALTKTMNSLRDISGRQEEVLSALDNSQSDVLRSELARREMVYKEALDKVAEDVFEVSKKSLFVSPILGRAILKISDQVNTASKDLAEGTGRNARRNVKASLGAMNQMVAGLMEAMDKASSCSSPSGMCEAFDSLEGMCASQMGINLGTQQAMGQGEQGEQGLSMEARAQMSRLAAEQQAVKKGLEDFTGQYGNRADMLGRLDDLIEEAKRVIEDLKRGSVNEETLKRQEQILTRMLDAQKSLRRREYTQRRKSRPGELYQVASPPPLSLEERERVVRDLLYKGRGYYPPEYEELIRAYFKAISLEKVKQ